MDTMINIRRMVLLAAAALVMLAVAACQKVNEEDLPNHGEVSFGVEAICQSDVQTRASEEGPIATRTEYSGLDQAGNEVNSSSTYERIDWLTTDGVEILCQQADGNKTANFGVTPGTASGNETNATIEPWDHKLYWGNGTHYFFGLYPSPLMDGCPSGVSIATSGSEGKAVTIHGTIPTTQTVTVSGNELKPNMAYAYMYAAATASSGNVKLHFKPLVTTLRFTLTSANAFPSGLTLSKIVLTSTQTGSSLAGSFDATITDSGLTALTSSNVTGGSNSITINVPSGVQLDTSTPLMFTILTLPMDQNSMKLTLNFSDGSSKTLNLQKSNGESITVHACMKCYINDVNLPWAYELIASPDRTFTYEGGSSTYSVTSYKHISDGGNNSGKVPVSWTAVAFSTDNGAHWVNTKPGAIEVFTDNGAGSGSATSYNVKIGHSPRTSAPNTQLLDADERGTQAAPWDLSLHTIKGGSISKTTANCYVVSAAGWYKFPLAYGNAYKEGNNNTDAYQPTATSSYTLNRFKKHDDSDITSPDISGVSRAELIWQDAEDLITVSDISVSNGYVVFHVDHNNIGEGNAVIAAKNSSGTILWSWHIWVTPFVNNITMRGKTYMERNLGWCDGGTISYPARTFKVRFQQAESNKTAVITFTQTAGNSRTILGSGPHFQWGRKDPMIPPSGEMGDDIDETYRANKIWYNAAGQTSQEVPLDMGSSGGRPRTLGYAIQHPMEMLWLNRANLPCLSPGTSWEYYDWTGDIGDYPYPAAHGWYVDDDHPSSAGHPAQGTQAYAHRNDTQWMITRYEAGHYCNLWNSKITITGHGPTLPDRKKDVSDYSGFQAHGKTVYDPCPIGYTIPVPYEIANLANIARESGGSSYLGSYTLVGTGSYTWDDTNKGYLIDGHLLPANGMRFYFANNPHVGSVGRGGYYFSSGPFNQHMILSLIFPYNTKSGQFFGVKVDGAFAKGSGRSIRCVPE